MTALVPSVLSGGVFHGSWWIWGYLDPGTGSMLFQILIAGLLSALFCVRTSYLNIKNTLFKHHDKV